jgi:hypothetical protein
MPSFRRFFIPSVSFRAFDQPVISNLDGQGLLMEWDVKRDNTPSADEGELRIYNLAPAASGAIHELWQTRAESLGFPCTLSVGWDGVPKKLIQADIYDIIPQQRTAVDVVSVFRFGDGGRNLRDAVTMQSYANVKINIAIELLVKLPFASPDGTFRGGLGLGYPKASRDLVDAAAAATPLPVLRTITKGLNTRKRITEMMRTIGLDWRVHNGAFIAMRAGAILDRPGVVLRPGTGLISYSKRNDGGISLEALANPDVEPGLQIQVQDDKKKPFGELSYRVEHVSFRGSTRGESLMLVEATK